MNLETKANKQYELLVFLLLLPIGWANEFVKYCIIPGLRVG